MHDARESQPCEFETNPGFVAGYASMPSTKTLDEVAALPLLCLWTWTPGPFGKNWRDVPKFEGSKGPVRMEFQ